MKFGKKSRVLRFKVDSLGVFGICILDIVWAVGPLLEPSIGLFLK